ncbi:hypothetical protein FLP10_15490 [Agromyces intestinalis]|uniref:DNA polymerase III subunit gamma/tau n=1 Tax=Agromyces intestinalis TaxID=2592652 RepID=A0A5C1YI81_9MICO|nr:hypothetical protein [Agromyces intestinalis]QEO15673.1 hypothetical protein FLP10_15490 [Agromyces intestinalis]
MSRESDDDALSWAGDDDPTLAPGWKVVGGPGGAETAAAEASANTRASATGDGTTAEPATAAARSTGSVELVVLGVLGGVYLLYTVGWLVTAVRTPVQGMGVLGDVMYGLGLWLAVLAPALWFGLGYAVVRRSHLRLIWIAVGAVVLVPLPFTMGMTA